ncbi:MAG TPA: flavodoxin family protein [Thermodesulfovibrionales bacterium]|nr:flavodoxin family protein [Thermodesulfovibrionales bacterium]
MNKVLGVVGSPRKSGNTYRMVSRILHGARSRGAETEIVQLSDLNILECDGCHACWKGKGCSKKDDMIGLYPRISGCDVLVLGTPVYWYAPTALMKGFVDRLVYYNCEETRKFIRNTRAVIAVPFEDETIETADLLLDFFRKCFSYLQVEFAANILAPGVTRRGEVAKNKLKMGECLALGKTLAGKEYQRLHNQAL